MALHHSTYPDYILVFELCGVAFRLAPPYGGLFVACHIIGKHLVHTERQLWKRRKEVDYYINE